MGRIYIPSTGAQLQLPAAAIVGRSHQAHIRIERPEISRFHLMLSWSRSGWFARSLSLSGSYVNTEALRPLEDRPLKEGDHLGLGRPDTDIILIGQEPPVLFARHQETGEERHEGVDGIALPDALIFLNLDSGWMIDDANGLRTLPIIPDEQSENGSTFLEIGPWRVYIPELDARTRQGHISLEALRLHLRYSSNLEHIQLEAHIGATTRDLGIYAEFWPLLILVRARKEGDGWVNMDALARQTGLNRKCLDIYLGRVRRHLSLLGIAGAEGIIESRRGERRISLPAEALSEAVF